jgi:hypothetical protein
LEEQTKAPSTEKFRGSLTLPNLIFRHIGRRCPIKAYDGLFGKIWIHIYFCVCYFRGAEEEKIHHFILLLSHTFLNLSLTHARWNLMQKHLLYICLPIALGSTEVGFFFFFFRLRIANYKPLLSDFANNTRLEAAIKVCRMLGLRLPEVAFQNRLDDKMCKKRVRTRKRGKKKGLILISLLFLSSKLPGDWNQSC